MAKPLKKLVGLLVAASQLFRFRRYILARFLTLSPPQNKVQQQQNIPIHMPDGVALVADLYRPARQATAPTVLIRTPYGRSGSNQFIAKLFAERGFNVLCQDARGRFGSAGTFEPYVHEADDGAATLAWIAEQPWSNGRIGMWGQSYVGYVQWAAASTGTPHLHAMLPAITQANLIAPTEQGFVWLDSVLRWVLLLDAMVDKTLSAGQRMALSYYGPAQNKKLEAGWNHLPLAAADEVILGRPEPFYRKWIAHYEPDAAYWQAIDFRAKVPQIDAPIHLVAGWHDIFLQGQLADYAALQSAGKQPYLTIGPWTHMAQQGMAAAVREGIAWFEAQLKGRREALRPFPVQIYLQGAEKWLDYPSWPPPAQHTPYFLQGMGQLSLNPPPADSRPDHYRYDPANPTPNLGGALLSIEAGRVDNHPLEARPDVLTYTTPPLTVPLTVIGAIRLRLFVKSSLAYCDFYGRLCDVDEDGRSLNVCDGVFRVQPGPGKLQPDGSLQIEVEIWPTAYQFQLGHRLRLQVSSGAHPRIGRNLGSGDPPMQATSLHPAKQTIFHDAAHPSALFLPIP